MEESCKNMRSSASCNLLPPGFEFDPTDEELVMSFLYYKAARLPYPYLQIIPQLDISLADPRHNQLKEKAFVSETGQNCYFFSRSKQQNRSTGNGLWKELGYVDPIFTNGGIQIGSKIYLGFYSHDDHGDQKFNWIMEEYHLSQSGLSAIFQLSEGKLQDYNEWVLCRVREASTVIDSQSYKNNGDGDDDDDVLSYLDQVYLSIDSSDDQEEETTFPI